MGRRQEAVVITKARSGRVRTIWSRLIVYAASVVAFAVLVAACSNSQIDGVGQVSDQAGTRLSHPAPKAAAPAADLSPAEAGLQLQALLGQHTVLAADLMRARLRGDPDLAPAANAALSKNTDAVSALVGSLFGAAAKAKFATLWAAHISALFNYARGLADQNDALRARVKYDAARYERQLAGFFAGASQGRLKPADAEAAVRMHIDHLVKQADAYAARDYRQANKIYREGYAHAFALGNALAATLLPPAVAATLTKPTWRLSSELDRLLGEHVVVLVAAMRAGVTNSPDFTAAAETVDANTRDLTGTMDTLFGPAAGHQFQSLWADRVDALIGYSAAVVKNDDAQRASNRAKLSAFETRIGAFLGRAVQKQMSAGALARAFRVHDDMLLREADAFAGKDYRQAHDLAYSAYQEMGSLAGQLANAFGATVASRLPVGAVQTGGEGTGPVVERHEHGR
jgi:hypothetical protein